MITITQTHGHTWLDVLLIPSKLSEIPAVGGTKSTTQPNKTRFLKSQVENGWANSNCIHSTLFIQVFSQLAIEIPLDSI